MRLTPFLFVAALSACTKHIRRRGWIALFPVWCAYTSICFAKPDRELDFYLNEIPQEIPNKKIRSAYAQKDGKSDPGGNVVIEFIDGSNIKLGAGGHSTSVQVAPDGKTLGFSLVGYYVDMKYELLVSTRAIVIFSNGKRTAVVEPEKQAIVEWAFRLGGDAIAISSMVTHGVRYFSLWNTRSGKRLILDDSVNSPGIGPRWINEPPKLIGCCIVESVDVRLHM